MCTLPALQTAHPPSFAPYTKRFRQRTPNRSRRGEKVLKGSKVGDACFRCRQHIAPGFNKLEPCLRLLWRVSESPCRQPPLRGSCLRCSAPLPGRWALISPGPANASIQVCCRPSEIVARGPSERRGGLVYPPPLPRPSTPPFSPPEPCLSAGGFVQVACLLQCCFGGRGHPLGDVLLQTPSRERLDADIGHASPFRQLNGLRRHPGS
jgi:hypothetical protein